MMFFGEGWPRDPWRTFVAAPPMQCLDCERPIQPDDSGVVMPSVGDEGYLFDSAWHRRCLMVNLGIWRFP